jgi:hypothetical protein
MEEPMNIQKAADILEIDLSFSENINITYESLKKKYHKIALQNHPDKNGNSIESNKKFQEINEAYHYFKEHIGVEEQEEEKINKSENILKTGYLYMLNIFILNITKGTNHNKKIYSDIFN